MKGHATIDATADYAARYAPVSCAPLGHTGLMVSQAGLGGYRISSGVSHHEKALRTAICSGINLIDTSTNYADGKTQAGDSGTLSVYRVKAILSPSLKGSRISNIIWRTG